MEVFLPVFLIVFMMGCLFLGIIMALPWENKRVKIIIITGPSGAGKTTIVGELIKRHPEWGMVLSRTSRAPRENKDLPGEYQCNVSKKRFLRWRKEGRDLWMVSEHGNMYATLKDDVDGAFAAKVVLFMQLLPDSVPKILDYVPDRVKPIFIVPPDEEELRRRLAKRGESPEQIERRIADCKNWEEEARESGIPYKFIRNDGTIAEAVEKVERIIDQNI